MTGGQVDIQNNQIVQVGQVVSERYEIVAHLGTGGFAKVFKAFDRVIERDVAIKFLDLRGISGGGNMVKTVLERFQREAKLAAKIPHRNVVNIFDIGKLDEEGFRPFIVMELLNGFDLEDQLTDHGPMSPSRLIPLFVDCLDALGQAHELGIVHKDLKPSNLFLSDPGQRAESLRIVDFGIAHIKSGGADEEDDAPGTGKRLTATGQILGTLQYLTPEYIATQTVSPALDVYQMALILVELLSGDRVIKTDNAFECLRIHTFGLLEIPQYLLASPLADVLHRALESDHLKRYANAKEFADALSLVDANSVPPSPLLEGATEVSTRTLSSTLSSPAIKAAPNTAEVRRPDSNNSVALATSELDQGFVPGDMSESSFVSKRTEVSREPTESTALASSLDPSLVADTLMDDDYVSPSNNNKLTMALAGVVVLILTAGGVLAMILQKEPTSAPEDTTSSPEQVIKEIKSAPTPPEIKNVEAPVVTAPDMAVPEVETDAPVIADKPQEEGDAKGSAAAQTEKSSKPKEKSARIVTLSVEPVHAQIVMNGKFLTNPARISIPAGKSRSSLITVSAEGYVGDSLRVKAREGERQFSLRKKKVSKPPVTTTQKAPKETTTTASEAKSTKPKETKKPKTLGIVD